MSPTYTLAQVQEDIATTRTAINNIMTNGQAVGDNGQILTRANLDELREHLSWLIAQETRLSRGGIRSRRGVPIRG